MTSVDSYRRLEASQEHSLRRGDLAVYAHPSDGVPRLCLPVAKIGVYADGEHVVLRRGDGGTYRTMPDADRFVCGYRFFDKRGYPREATASEYIAVVDRELQR